MANDFDKIKEALDKIKPAEFEWKSDLTDNNITVDTSQSDLDSMLYGSMSSTININAGSATGPHIYTTNNTSGQYLYSNGNVGNSYTTNHPYSGNPFIISNSGTTGLHVSSDAEFEGDIKWKGRSLGKLLEGIEDRLALIVEPDPEKLKKFAALKKAYDHYKLMEKLIGE
jgi:hypothetical protein